MVITTSKISRFLRGMRSPFGLKNQYGKSKRNKNKKRKS
jgi:hypothetical protein